LVTKVHRDHFGKAGILLEGNARAPCLLADRYILIRDVRPNYSKQVGIVLSLRAFYRSQLGSGDHRPAAVTGEDEGIN